MKKVLLTTTALTMLAGAAVADVSVSGSARFGLTLAAGAWTLGTRTRVNFSGSGETDGGLTFGMSTRINTGLGAAGTINSPAVWISNGMATLTVGNTDGAIASSVALYGGSLGFTGNGGLRPATHAGYVEGSGGGAGPGNVKVGFALGSFNVVASAVPGSGVTEMGASYSAGSFTVAAGTSSVGTSYSATYAAGDMTVGVLSTGSNYRVWGTYGMGATTLKLTHTKVVAGTTTGVGVTHSLGGGASVSASYGTSPAGNAGEVGMNFSF